MENNTALTYEELLAKVGQLEKDKANSQARGTSLKIGEKGGVSFYGLGRFPITLYRSQWETLIAKAPEITAFIEANSDKLASKPAKV